MKKNINVARVILVSLLVVGCVGLIATKARADATTRSSRDADDDETMEMDLSQAQQLQAQADQLEGILAGRMVIASSSSNTASAVSAVTGETNAASPQGAIPVTSCENITQPGNYVLTHNLTAPSDSIPGCINIVNTQNVQLSCNNFSIAQGSASPSTDIVISTSSNYSIENCILLGGASPGSPVINDVNSPSGTIENDIVPFNGYGSVDIAGSDNVTITSNTIDTGLSVQGNNEVITNNIVDLTGATELYADDIDLSSSTNSIISNNTINGGWSRSFTGADAENGADDDINTNYVSNVTISSNTLMDAWDTGIEPIGFMNNSVISNNTIINTANAGIGGWFYLSMQGDAITGNMMSQSARLFMFVRDLNLLPTEQAAYFLNNTFTNNSLINPSAGGLNEVDVVTGDENTIPANQFVRGNNVFTGNVFNGILEPDLQPYGMFVDGGGNTCGSTYSGTGGASPLDCTGTAVPPLPPLLNSATTTNSGQVDLAWSWIPSQNSPTPVGYQILRNGGIIGSVSSSVFSYSDTTAAPGVSYTYTVKAFSGANIYSAPSNAIISSSGGLIPSPTISSFSASPSTITAGQSATLSWSVTGATSISITGIGTVTGSSATVSPSVTTIYTLTATNSAGSVTAMATVTVNPIVSLPAISSFSASPATVTSGQSATLSWSVTGAASISITGIGTVTGSSVSVSPSVTTTYTLTATNSAGSATATATVTVNSPVDTTPPSAPSLTSATASGPTQVGLSWAASTDNVGVAGYQITRNGSVIGSVGSSVLSYADANVAAGTSYTYSVKAYDAAGNYSAASNALTVVTPNPVVSLPAISSFSASPATVAAGQSATLSWSVSGATVVSVSGIGTVTGSSASVSPAQTTTYTLTATNSGGSVTAMATVTVTAQAAPAIAMVTPVPGQVVSGYVTLTAATNFVPNPQTLAASFDGGGRGKTFTLSPSGSAYAASVSTYVLPDGAHTLTVTGYDAQGILHSVSESFTVDNNGTPVSLPAISSFSASPSAVTSGQSATLSWSVTGAASISITGIGTVTGSSVSVSPSVTTTYTLTATNSAGSATATATVTVNSPVDTTPPSAPSLTSATASGPTQVGLSWAASTDNVGVAGYQITRNGSVIGSVGSSVLSYADANVAAGTSYTYSVKAYDAAGNYSAASNALTVVTPNPVVSLPAISSFSASPATVAAGQSATLSWSVSGATVVSVSGIGTVTGSSASVSPAQTTTYTLTATNSAGSVTAMATVTVIPKTAGITIVSPTQSQLIQGTLYVTATANFTPDANGMIATIDNSKVLILSYNGGVYTAGYSTARLGDGTHSITISANDTSGALHTATVTFIVAN